MKTAFVICSIWAFVLLAIASRPYESQGGYTPEDVAAVSALIPDDKAEILADLWGINDSDLTAKTNIFGE